jgi:hypothetical protein
VVLIDAPPGYNENEPGRLLPTFWTVNNLTLSGSRIYLHDVGRDLEKFLVKEYIKRKPTKVFSGKHGILFKFVI